MTDARLTSQQVQDATDRREFRQTRARWRVAAALAALIAVADQIVKEVVRSTMDMGEAHTLIAGLLDLRRVRNEGIAFGFFPGNTVVVGILTVVALTAITVAMLRLVRRNTYAAVGGGLLLGGAAGNLFDRLVHGGVTDYIDFRWFPAFNVADNGITIGAVVLVLGLLMIDDEEGEAPPGAR